jgi:hypothetical protein
MPAKSKGGGGGGGSPIIAGSLPWGQGGGGMFDYMSSSDPEKALAAHYRQAYDSALAMNQQNYANILSGFQKTALSQMGAQRAIGKGYQGLMDSVLGKIASVGNADRQYLTDLYTGRQGEAMQHLIGSGLGNTTVTSSINRGLTLDEAKANMQLSEQLAKMYAGYQTDIGTKHLAYRERASDARTGQANQQMNWMNSVQAQYPDANAYSQIAQGLGAAEAAKEQQRQLESLMFSAGQAAEIGSMGGAPGMGSLNAFNARNRVLDYMGGGGGQGPLGSPQMGGMPGGFSMGGGGGGYQNPMGAISPGLNAIHPGLGGLASAGYGLASGIGAMSSGLNSIYPGLGGLYSGMFSPPSGGGGYGIGLGGYASGGGSGGGTQPSYSPMNSAVSGLGHTLMGLFGGGGY